MKHPTHFITVLISAVAALILGCAAVPFDYHPDTEIPRGPGIFTKEAGALTLYTSRQSSLSGDPTSSSEDSPQADATGADADTAAFREFQQWRRERGSFEAFQQWKQSRQGSAEYEEFKEWQRWQHYKKWQESH
jgi:hypothetical protein